MNELERLIEQFTPQIRRAFRLAIKDITDRAIIADMIKAIRAGDPVAAFRAVGFSEAALRPITAMIERAFEVGGVTVASSFPGALNALGIGRIVFRFDVRNSRAEAWLRDHSSTLVTRLTEEARENVRHVLQQGMIDGRNPRNVALDIVGRLDKTTQTRYGGIIGLNAPQERFVANMRTDLMNLDSRYFTREMRDKRFDGMVRAAIEAGRPLNADMITKLTGRYADRLLNLRGQTISRTEAISALNRSQYEAYKQAIAAGTINEAQVIKIWDATGDKRTRPSHMKLHSQKRGLDDPFETERGAKLMYPGDTSLKAPAGETVNCRCRVKYDVDFLADWE